MKKFKVTIVVTTKNCIKPEDFILQNHDVIDGFELTREGDDTTSVFKLEDAYIDSIEQM